MTVTLNLIQDDLLPRCTISSVVRDGSPTARALLALETIQNVPGITSELLGERLGVTERAARRYVAILREAGLPIESATGPAGGYRVGRGLRLPPLMFTPAEAMGLAMAVIEGHRGAADPTDLVGAALAKILRILPERVAQPVMRYRSVIDAGRQSPQPDAELASRLIAACTAARRLRVRYDTGRTEPRRMDVDPWAVVLRHSYWYLLCWSHTVNALRVLRIDRVASIDPLPETFVPPEDLDALRTLEEHLSQGWRYEVDVLVESPPEHTRHFLPRSLARLEAADGDRTRLRATTSEPDWYARQLAVLPVPWRVIASPELRRAVAALGRGLGEAATAG
jgi:predicted DNA-binding transcriptional regulator YafY